VKYELKALFDVRFTLVLRRNPVNVLKALAT
jgi:hypothetical protein